MRRSKYGVRTDKAGKEARTVDNICFHSKKEAKRYMELKLAQNVGLISELELQPTFDLSVNGVLICRYRADFRYRQDRKQVVEDAKGFKTPEYKLKKKLMLAIHGIEIQEV